MTRITSDLFEVCELAHHGPENLLISSVMIVLSFGYLLSIDWILTLIIFTCVPILVVENEKLRKAMKPAELAREAGAKSMLEGKTFWTYRVSADKSRNRINHAFYQQLPSDWIKIVGRNNISKYTLAFDMMYFAQPGTDVRQFPPGLFDNYWNDFNSLIIPAPRRDGAKVVYAEKSSIDVAGLQKRRPDAEVLNENGRWYYWVTLPVDKAFTIEVDEALPEVTPPLAGLFIGLLQFADLQAIQLQLYQNPPRGDPVL